MDLKCPSSGECDRNLWDNISHLTESDEVKFVIADRNDYDWACDALRHYNLQACCPVLFAPVFGRLQPRDLAEWIMSDRLPVRLQLQIHKYIWDPEVRSI
jgi:7-carboxy-7-deazaguanine synthase